MKLHHFFFWFLLLFLPTQFGKHFWPDFALIFGLRIDYLAPTIYFTDLLVLGIFLSFLWEKFRSTSLKPLLSGLKHFWFPALFLFYLLLSCLLAQNPEVALFKFLKIVELLFLGFYISQNFSFVLRKAALPLSLGLLFESSLFWAQFFKQGSLDSLFWSLGERRLTVSTPGVALSEFGGRLLFRPYGTFSHPNSLAGFFLVDLVLLFGLRSNLSFWFKTIVVFLGVTVILFSFSRAVWLAGFLVPFLVLGWWFWQKKKKELIIGEVFFLLGMGVIFRGLLDLGSQAVQERMKLLNLAWLMFRKFPLTGVGLNNFLVFLPRFWSEQQVYFLQPVHNIFLLIGAESGLVGLLVFVWFLWLTIKRALKAKRLLFLLALILILFTGLFDHYWFTLPQNQLLATLVFGLLWGKMKT